MAETASTKSPMASTLKMTAENRRVIGPPADRASAESILSFICSTKGMGDNDAALLPRHLLPWNRLDVLSSTVYLAQQNSVRLCADKWVRKRPISLTSEKPILAR